MRRRWFVALRLVWLVQARSYFYHVYFGLAVLTVLAFRLALPESFVAPALPLFLLGEPGMMGLFMVAAHLYYGLNEGSVHAVAVTPLGNGEIVTALAVGSAVVPTAAGVLIFGGVIGVDLRLVWLVPPLFLMAVVSGLLGLATATFFDEFTRFILGSIPIMLAALPARAGLPRAGTAGCRRLDPVRRGAAPVRDVDRGATCAGRLRGLVDLAGGELCGRDHPRAASVPDAGPRATRAPRVNKYSILLRKDLRGVYRDGFLAPLMLYPLVFALAARGLVAVVPLEHLGLYLAPAMPTIGTTMIGTIFGFALIEEREQRTWLLLRVVPVGQGLLFRYFVTSSSLLSALTAIGTSLVYGMAVVQPAVFVAMVGVSLLTAPLMALSMGAVAANKIEGFALAKILSSLMAMPALVFVLPPAWQLALAWNPFYWIYVGLLPAFAAPETLQASAVSWPALSPWICAAAALVLSLSGIVVAGRAYRRRAAG